MPPLSPVTSIAKLKLVPPVFLINKGSMSASSSNIKASGSSSSFAGDLSSSSSGGVQLLNTNAISINNSSFANLNLRNISFG